MPLPDIDTALDWRGRNVIDRNGEKIGKFDELYLDEETSKPEWAAVTTGLFGRKQTMIPLSEASLEGDDLQVPFDQEHVKNAPALDPDEQISQEDERQLYGHYGIDHSSSGSDTVLPEAGQEGAAASGQPAEGETTSGRATGEESTRGETTGQGAPGSHGTQAGDRESAQAGAPSGEEDAASGGPGSDERAGAHEGANAADEGGLYVGTEARPRERVRLKKYVVTEEVTKKVPVTREEVRLEREPVGEGNEEAEQTVEGEEQVVLSEEEPVVHAPEETEDQREQR